MCKKCSVEGCNNKHKAKGYCAKHYWQMREYGKIIKTRFDANEIIEYDDYAELILYNKQCEEIERVYIDLDDIEGVQKYKWCLSNTGYDITRTTNNEYVLMHRFITNCPDNLVVDHINHNKLDNRKCNLRTCTSQENNKNIGRRCDNSSGITGVYWDKRRNKWYGQICINGKKKFLGYYTTKEEAIETRKQAEIEYFGEYAPNTED